MSHNFSSRYASKLIKSSKDSYSSQDSNKTLSPKKIPLGRGPGPGKDGQNNAKTPLLVTLPPEKLIPKKKKNVLICNSRLAESVECLNSSLAQSPGELWFCKIKKNCKKVSQAGLKFTVVSLLLPEKKPGCNEVSERQSAASTSIKFLRLLLVKDNTENSSGRGKL